MRTFLALVVFAVVSSAATYTVKAGDTLGGIAHRFHVPVGAIAQRNAIKNVDRVYAGQMLVIPDAIPGAVLISASKPAATHIVKGGETLSEIAKRFGVSTVALARSNKIANPNRIRIGQTILVSPGASPSATWVCPIVGGTRFVDDFGAPRPGHRKHLGTDLLAPRATPIVATVSGRFERNSNNLGGLAYYLHGDDGRTYYGAHLLSYVRGDGRVRVGDIIGTVGDSGDARGGPTHLHFEVMVKSGNANPYALLKQACPKR